MHQTSDTNAYDFGEVKIDLVARQVLVSGKVSPLTPTEYSLLTFFIQRPNQALRRERIIDSIFRNPDSATEALQNVYVSRLRRKLEPTGVALKPYGVSATVSTPERHSRRLSQPSRMHRDTVVPLGTPTMVWTPTVLPPLNTL